MKKIIIKCIFTLLFVLSHLSLFSQNALLPNIVGQYPLKCKVNSGTVDYAKFYEINPWDVSNSNNHGTVKLTSTQIDPDTDKIFKVNKTFEATDSLNGQTYLSGVSRGYIHLENDPFQEANSLNSLTVGFWSETGATGTVLDTKFMKITIDEERCTMYYKTNSQSYTHSFTLENSTIDWNSIVIAYSVTSGFTFYVNDVPKEDILPGNTALEVLEGYGNRLSVLAKNFSRGLANVIFLNTKVQKAQLDLLKDLMIDQAAYAQRKFRNYPLDAPNLGQETKGTHNNGFFIKKNGQGTVNRFGSPRKAIYFANDASMGLPHLFENRKSTAINLNKINRGFTISLWIKITKPSSTDLDNISNKIKAAPKNSILYGIQSGDSTPIFGLQRVEDRLGIYTYIQKSDDIKIPWYNWFYDPVSLRKQTGWFHIIYVQHEYWSKTYVVKFGDAVNCDCKPNDWDCLRDCQMHYDYTSFKPLDNIDFWGLGSAGPGYRAETAIDDFSVYRWPMNVEEVTALHASEQKNEIKNHNPSTAFAVIGDQGCRGEMANKVAQNVKKFNPAYILGLGDDNYADRFYKNPSNCGPNIDANTGFLYHDFIHPYKGRHGSGNHSKNKFWSVLGNHDYKKLDASGKTDPDLLNEWTNFFSYPNNGRYYDKVIGDVHIFALNNNLSGNSVIGFNPEDPDGASPTSKQALWLKGKLEGSTAKYRIVICHVPPYTQVVAGPQGPPNHPILRWPFKKWGASAVFSGDQHFYERNEIDGFTYVVNGLGGADILENRQTKPIPEHKDATKFQYKEGQYGFMICDPDPKEKRITCKFYTVDDPENEKDKFFIYPYNKTSFHRKNETTKIKQEEISVEKDIASKFLLYPNPSKDGNFTLEFGLKKEGAVRFEILSLVGQLIYQKQKQHLAKGKQKLQFTKSDINLASGVYIVKVHTNEFSETRKLVVE